MGSRKECVTRAGTLLVSIRSFNTLRDFEGFSVALQDEGISNHVNLTDALPEDDPVLTQTLVCFVLVDRISREHTFCSRYDFGPWPLLSSFAESNVSAAVFTRFTNTAAVMMNGFVFDELSPEVVSALAQHAHDAGAAVFFDPGTLCQA